MVWLDFEAFLYMHTFTVIDLPNYLPSDASIHLLSSLLIQFRGVGSWNQVPNL